uniref:ethanolamine-phosphate cytidylyltransferase n=1 Tax=Romanomermis culicivorax TaxID=13658 RepID=A0A915KZM9_ROMCU
MTFMREDCEVSYLNTNSRTICGSPRQHLVRDGSQQGIQNGVLTCPRDEAITKNKGIPVFTQEQRYKMIKGIKWVDEVFEGSTYFPTAETLRQYKCDFAAHGDDISITTNGEDPYEMLKNAVPYLLLVLNHIFALDPLHSFLATFKRTEGVSTTDIVNRMLRLTKSHHSPDGDAYCEDQARQLSMDHYGQRKYHISGEEHFGVAIARSHIADAVSAPAHSALAISAPNCAEVAGAGMSGAELTGAENENGYVARTRVTKFLQTSNKILQFSEGKDPKSHFCLCIYADPGHLDFLEAASKEGDYLIVGVHSDVVVNRKKHSNYPIMNLHERTLSLLACRFVSEVVIDAPYTLTEDMINQLKIDLVCHGWTSVQPDEDTIDPFKVPKEQGKFKIIDTGNRLTTCDIVKKFAARRLEYELRNAKKNAREKESLTSHIIPLNQKNIGVC